MSLLKDTPRAAVWLVALGLACSPSVGGDSWEIVVDVGGAGGGNVEAQSIGVEDHLDPGFVAGISGIRSIAVDKAFEFGWLHQRTSFGANGVDPGGGSFDIDVDAFDFAGTYRPDKKGRRPFVSVSLGLMRFAPEAAGFDDDYSFSMAVVGGTTFRLTPRLGLRLLARGRLIFESTQFAGVCGAGGCTVELFGNGPFRLEGSLGLVIRP